MNLTRKHWIQVSCRLCLNGKGTRLNSEKSESILLCSVYHVYTLNCLVDKLMETLDYIV